MLKKWIALFLAVVLLVSLAACGKEEEAPLEDESLSEQLEAPEEEPAEEAPETEEPVEEDVVTGELELAPPEPEAPEFRNQFTGAECTEEEMTRRPISIMINNMTIAQQRVQTSLSHADLILETYIEGYVTRLLAFYKDIDGIGQIGTIRSARIDYARIANAYDSLYIHVGEDPSYCADYLEGNGIDDINFQDVTYWFREPNGLSTEHTLYSTDELIEECISDLGRRMETDVTEPWVSFLPTEDAENAVLAAGEDCTLLDVDFSSIQRTSFHYDESTGLYERWSCGEQLTDYKTGEVTKVKNVFVLGTTTSLYEDGVHVNISLSGGDGYYASEGKIVPITWSTDSSGRFVITQPDGSELPVNIGTSYVCLNLDSYEPTWE